MDAVRATRITALGVVALAVARVPWFAAHHHRPALGAEAADLQRAMFYHWGLREHIGWGWWEQMSRDGFKPPLWYGGVPLLGTGSPVIDLDLVLAVNAVVLAVLAAGVWRLAESISPGGAARLAGPFAALLLVGLPGIAGRITVAGVEPLHAAIFILWLLALRRLRTEGALPVLVGGLVLGAGFLAKWSFAVYALGPWLWEAGTALRGPNGRAHTGRLVCTGLIGVACFSTWWSTAFDATEVLLIATAEPRFEGDPLAAAFFYPRQLARYLGLGGAVLVAGLGWIQWRGSVPGEPSTRPAGVDVGLVLVAVASVVLPHVFIPHREARYLVPAIAPLAVLFALPAARAAAGQARVPRWMAAVVLAPLVFTFTAMQAPPSVNFGGEELRLRPDPEDYGLDVLTRHPSFARRDPNLVTYSIPQPAAAVLTALDWAFYGRNDTPVLGRGNFLDLTERAAAFDLERSTHVVTARDLSDQERAVLASMGFVLTVSAATVDLPDFPSLTLWVLDADLQPPKRGPGPAPPP